MANWRFSDWLRRIILWGAFIGLTAVLAHGPGQSDFGILLSLFGPLFLLYLFTYLFIRDEEVKTYLFLGILLRLVVLFAFPQLSDDIYRFVWDGRLIINGYNPFDHLPAYYVEKGIAVPGLNRELYDLLNSSEYFTIYPPVAQAVFAGASWLFPDSIWWNTFVIKLFLLVMECGSIWLLVKLLKYFELPSRNVLLYALNPLIIIEICGNLHFEGAMIFFLLLAFWLLVKEKLVWSGGAMALSVASKLLPVIFLPFLIRRLGWKKSFIYFVVVGLFLIILFSLIVNATFLENFGSSLDLYFRQFEFNASVFYLVRWVGQEISGFNLILYIGPSLALITLLSIGLLALLEKKPSLKTWPVMMMWSICIYYLLSTTVHPWYASLPLVLCLFTRYRFPVIWSGLIFLSYSHYNQGQFLEHFWLIGLEYGVVLGVLGYEILKGRLEDREIGR